MQVVVDGRTLCSPFPRGTGKTFTEVYTRLATLRGKWRFLLLHRIRDCPVGRFDNLDNVTTRFVDIKGDRLNLWPRLRLPLAARLAKAGVLHCPANTGPGHPAVPLLLTIHDLIPLQPELVTPESKKWGRRVAIAARKARFITTPSEYTKRQIVETFGIRPEKIAVHHWAANPTCQPVVESALLNRVRRRYGIEPDRPYVIAFGGADLRKNTRRILEAWLSLPDAVGGKASLLVVGMQEPLLGELRQVVDKAESQRRCRLVGYVPEEDLPTLLSGAMFLCFPSLSEGFGLPVLDAFACETAVLTSRVTSIPEVAGDAALYVDPRSIDSIARDMNRLLEDESLRKDLVARGAERLKQFSWEHCANVFADVLEQFA